MPTDFDFGDVTVDTDGVYVSADGKYTCHDCETVLEATGEATVVDGRRRGIFTCPTCGEDYPC